MSDKESCEACSTAYKRSRGHLPHIAAPHAAKTRNAALVFIAKCMLKAKKLRFKCTVYTVKNTMHVKSYGVNELQREGDSLNQSMEKGR